MRRGSSVELRHLVFVLVLFFMAVSVPSVLAQDVKYLGTTTKPLYDVSMNFKLKPTYGIEQYVTFKPVYDIQMHSKVKPVYDVQQFVRTRPVYDVRAYSKVKPLYNIAARPPVRLGI